MTFQSQLKNADTGIMKKSKPESIVVLDTKKSNQIDKERCNEEKKLLVGSFDVGPDAFCPLNLVKMQRERRNLKVSQEKANVKEFQVRVFFSVINIF